MNKLTHSEGPWRADVSGQDERPPYDVNILRPDGLAVAVAVQNGDIEREVALGNGHLIASATEMLALVREYRDVVNFFIGVHARTGDTEGANLRRLTLHRIDLVLAKVEGRS